MIGVARCVWVRFGGVRDPISGRVAGSDGQTMANLEVRELKKRISQQSTMRSYHNILHFAPFYQ
eukprot:scaffold121401_cov36-Cyclotella_meneghiniana.AAC.1